MRLFTSLGCPSGYLPTTYFLVLVLSSAVLAGQNPAPAGNHTFTDQPAIDAFLDAEGRYTSVSGNLTIDATGTITDLSNLALLETISGNLTIINYGADESIGDPLAELASLHTVNSILVGAATGTLNPGLTALTSTSLTQVGNRIVVTRSEQLVIVDLPAVVNVSSRIVASRLTSLTSFRLPEAACQPAILSLVDLPVLTDLQLNRISQVTDLTLTDLDALENLDGLSGLATLGNSPRVKLMRNASLHSVAGLGSDEGGLTLLQASLEIRDNPLLTSLASFSGTTGSSFVLTGNPQLTDLGGGLTFDGYLFYILIAGNDLLPSVATLFSGTDTLGVEALDIFDNASLSDLGSRPIRLASDMYLSNNPEISDLPNLTATSQMTGAFQGLYIEHNPKLDNLSGLGNLASIGGDVYIADNAGLTTLDGLDNLQTVGGSLVIARNDLLLNLDALRELATIGSLLEVTHNQTLSECCALQCSVLVQDQPVSQDNPFVTITGNQGDCADAATLDASSCPTACLSASPALPVSLIEFSGEAGVQGSLLQWITGIERGAAYFTIGRSATGQDFTEIGRVSAAGDRSSVTAYRFRDLNTPQGITFYRLIAVDTDGSISNTRVIALEGNEETRDWSIFPNPAGTRTMPVLRVPVNMLEAEVTVAVYNAMGRRVSSVSVLHASEILLATHSLPAGVYTAYVSTAHDRHVRQFVIR